MGKGFCKKKEKRSCLKKSERIRLDGGCAVKRLAARKQMERIVFLLFHFCEMNSMCAARVAKSSSSNKRADGLSLEINLIWKQRSPHGERLSMNTPAFSSTAHIHSFISGFHVLYSFSLPTMYLSISLCSYHCFYNSFFGGVFTRALGAKCRIPAREV